MKLYMCILSAVKHSILPVFIEYQDNLRLICCIHNIDECISKCSSWMLHVAWNCTFYDDVSVRIETCQRMFLYLRGKCILLVANKYLIQTHGIGNALRRFYLKFGLFASQLGEENPNNLLCCKHDAAQFLMMDFMSAWNCCRKNYIHVFGILMNLGV